ncbi:MAG: hypothetical protein R3F14_37555, partial [Polyangiaceae bacterium]
PVIDGALATKGVLGDVLILTGHADGDTLERIAGHQLELRLVRLFGLPPATVYRYFEGHAALDDVPGPGSRGDILHVLATGTRAHPRSAMPLGKLMDHLGEVRLGLHPDAVLDRFCFDEDESKVATAVLAGKPTFVELLSAEIAPADVVRRVVYLFLLTRQLDIGFGHGQRLPPLGIEETLPPVAVGRVALRAAMHRHGAAVPDPSGDGERAAVQPRTLRRRRPPISGPGTILGPDAEPPSDVCEPVSDIVEIGGAPDSRARESSTGTGGKGGDR